MSAIRFLCIFGFIAYFPTTLLAQTSPQDNCKFFNKFTVDPRPMMTVDGSSNIASNSPDQESHNFHPGGLMGDPFLFLEQSVYHLWFSGVALQNNIKRQGMAHSSSPTLEDNPTGDPPFWTDTKNASERITLVLEPEPIPTVNTTTPNWDHMGLETPAIVREPTVQNGPTGQKENDGQLRLYYSGVKADGAYEIGFATASGPGATWTKYPAGSPAPVFTVDPNIEWEQPIHDPSTPNDPTDRVGGVLEPSVIYDGSEYLMWYATIGFYPCPHPPACKDVNGNGPLTGEFGGRIGFARSPDGVDWTRDHPAKDLGAIPPILDDTYWVLGPDSDPAKWDSLVVGHPNVIARLNNSGYHMFYLGQRTEGNEVISGLGHAYSPDGKHWEKNPNNPIITSKNPAPSLSEAEWLDYILGGPTAMYETDGTLKLTFMASPVPDFNKVNFGLATTTCDVAN